jgi:hypothetical protein
MLEHGADPNAIFPLALGFQLKDTIELLIEHGADVNRATEYGTPLASVRRFGGSGYIGTPPPNWVNKEEIVELLISKGATK